MELQRSIAFTIVFPPLPDMCLIWSLRKRLRLKNSWKFSPESHLKSQYWWHYCLSCAESENCYTHNQHINEVCISRVSARLDGVLSFSILQRHYLLQIFLSNKYCQAEWLKKDSLYRFVTKCYTDQGNCLQSPVHLDYFAVFYLHTECRSAFGKMRSDDNTLEIFCERFLQQPTIEDAASQSAVSFPSEKRVFIFSWCNRTGTCDDALRS